MWHVGFCVDEVLVVRGIFGVETKLDVYKSRLDGCYEIVKSVWVRIKEQFVLFYILKECVADCTEQLSTAKGGDV